MDNESFKKIRILVVEDCPDLRMLFESILDREGMTVYLAENGKRALDILTEISFDIILTDMIMPVMDGFAFLKNYLATKSPVPVIAMSSLSTYLLEAKIIGASTTLLKPFDPARLGILVRSMVNKEELPFPPFPVGLVTEEAKRLATIRKLKLDELAPEQSIHTFMEEVASYFDCPAALFSVVTEDRQFWTAGCGIPDEYQEKRGGPRSDSFCTHAVAAKAALVVQDASKNPVFRENPFVVNNGFRFYAGVPLIARRGEPLGTLCIIDLKPKSFSYYDLELLSLFGRRVLSTVEKREHAAAPEIPESSFRYLSYIDDEFETFGRAAICDLVTVEGCRAVEKNRTVSLVLIAIDCIYMAEMIELMKKDHPKSLIGRIGIHRLAWIVPESSAAELEDKIAKQSTHFNAIKSIQLDRYPGFFQTTFEELEMTLPK